MAGTPGYSNWEQDDMMSQSQPHVMRHLHNITKQLLILNLKDTEMLEGEGMFYRITYAGIK